LTGTALDVGGPPAKPKPFGEGSCACPDLTFSGLKRRVDKSDASAIRGAELKKLVQEVYCTV